MQGVSFFAYKLREQPLCDFRTFNDTYLKYLFYLVYIYSKTKYIMRFTEPQIPNLICYINFDIFILRRRIANIVSRVSYENRGFGGR